MKIKTVFSHERIKHSLQTSLWSKQQREQLLWFILSLCDVSKRENVRLNARKRKTAANINNTLRESERTGTLI